MTEQAPVSQAGNRADPLRPINWQDVRLTAGEGNLTGSDVLAACNAELARRGPLLARFELAVRKQAMEESAQCCDHYADAPVHIGRDVDPAVVPAQNSTARYLARRIRSLAEPQP